MKDTQVRTLRKDKDDMLEEERTCWIVCQIPVYYLQGLYFSSNIKNYKFIRIPYKNINLKKSLNPAVSCCQQPLLNGLFHLSLLQTVEGTKSLMSSALHSLSLSLDCVRNHYDATYVYFFILFKNSNLRI